MSDVFRDPLGEPQYSLNVCECGRRIIVVTHQKLAIVGVMGSDLLDS